VDTVFEQCRETLGVKCAEYASGADRLDNFHRQGVMQGQDPIHIGLTLLCKHITGLCIALEHLPVGSEKWAWRTSDGAEGLQQRFVDAINYLLLLYALVDESVGEVPDE